MDRPYIYMNTYMVYMTFQISFIYYSLIIKYEKAKTWQYTYSLS